MLKKKSTPTSKSKSKVSSTIKVNADSEDNLKKCTDCRVFKAPVENFYMSYSKMHSDNRVPICKVCILDMLDVEDVETVKDVLRQIDRPYISHLWDSAITNVQGKEPFGSYMKLISMKDYKNKTWNDSDDDEEESYDEELTYSVVDEEDFQVTPIIVKKWGAGYNKAEYSQLETLYLEMKTSYEIDTASHRDYLKKICKASLMMDKHAHPKTGSVDLFKKVSDVYDKLMHSAKFTAVQRSAADKTGGLNTFSEFAEFCEKQGFIPVFPDEVNDKVDRTLHDLKNFTRHLVLGDPNLANILEASINKMNEKEESSEVLDENSEDYDVDFDDEDFDESDEIGSMDEYLGNEVDGEDNE
jgi:hypothetical protein